MVCKDEGSIGDKERKTGFAGKKDSDEGEDIQEERLRALSRDRRLPRVAQEDQKRMSTGLPVPRIRDPRRAAPMSLAVGSLLDRAAEFSMFG